MQAMASFAPQVTALAVTPTMSSPTSPGGRSQQDGKVHLHTWMLTPPCRSDNVRSARSGLPTPQCPLLHGKLFHVGLGSREPAVFCLTRGGSKKLTPPAKKRSRSISLTSEVTWAVSRYGEERGICKTSTARRIHPTGHLARPHDWHSWYPTNM